MIVSFWNSSGIRSGVSTNAACTAFFYALRFKQKTALFENHVPEKSGLYDLLIGKKSEDSIFEEPIYYNKENNINYIYGLIKSGFPMRDFDDAAVSLANGKLHYFPQHSYGNHALLDYELNKVIDRFMDELESRYETVFVDLKHLNTMTMKKVIERSELIFLNLLPDRRLVNEFFFSYRSVLDKVYFVFSKASFDSDFSIDSFLEDYPADPERVAYIPYNEGFERVCRNGNLAGFLKKHKWATVGEKSFELIYQYRRMTNYLHRYQERRKGEIHVSE